MSELKLGMGPLPEPIFLYVGQESDGESLCGWYHYDHKANIKIPVSEPALTGYLIRLRLIEKRFQKRDNLKLDLFVRADVRYVIRSGIETNFTRKLLLSLDAVEDLTQPLTIAVLPGDQGKTVFARVYLSTGELVRAEWDGDLPIEPLINRLAQRLGQTEVQTHRGEDGSDSASAPPARTSEQELLRPTASIDRLWAKALGLGVDVRELSSILGTFGCESRDEIASSQTSSFIGELSRIVNDRLKSLKG